MDETDFMHFLNYDDARLILSMIEMAIDKGHYVNNVRYDANDRHFCVSFDGIPIDVENRFLGEKKEEA